MASGYNNYYGAYGVSGGNIDYATGKRRAYTWEDFYEVLEKERSNGDMNTPQAANIAFDLLLPHIISLPCHSMYTDSETLNDVAQSAYLEILDKIRGYDISFHCGFPTYLGKWFKGLARKVRNGEIPEHKAGNIIVESVDKMVHIANDTDVSNGYDMIADGGNSVEEILEKKSRERSSALFRSLIGKEIDESVNDEDKTRMFVNAAFYTKLFGGFNDFPETLCREVENIIQEREAV